MSAATTTIQKITPLLWFPSDLDVAVEFYTSIFPDARVKEKTRAPDGTIFSAIFVLAGQEFYAMNGGVQNTFNESLSLFISCEDQKEVDHYWDSLLEEGGKENQCGWLKDRFGVVWQVIPKSLWGFLNSDDKVASERARQKMFTMKKIVIADIEKAWNGE
ncbi:3-demethylubiquinone-9 3-methyltransferase [Serendipita vermifera]|nr:3-demethylubiquinone-9 3-methyltransferase [Serendipita vermifera]